MTVCSLHGTSTGNKLKVHKKEKRVQFRNLDVGENQQLTTLRTETMSVSHLSVVVFNFKRFKTDEGEGGGHSKRIASPTQ